MEQILKDMLSLSEVKISTEQDPSKIRLHKEADIICGNKQKIEKAIGWQAQIPLTVMLSDLLNYWRNLIKK